MTNKFNARKAAKDGYTKADWDAVASPPLTEAELAEMRPAKEMLPVEFFEAMRAERRKRGRPRLPAAKEAVTLRLDPATVEKFKSAGDDWRTRMSEALDKARV